jgi:hypothetical protein
VKKNKRIRTNQNQQNQTFSTPTTTNKQNKQQTNNKQTTNKQQQLFFHHHLTGTPDVAGHGGDPAAQHLFNGHVHQVGLFHS